MFIFFGTGPFYAGITLDPDGRVPGLQEWLEISGVTENDRFIVGSFGADAWMIPALFTRRLYIDAGGGNDRVELLTSLRVPATILGGAGDDTLIAASHSRATLAGGDGDDLIMAELNRFEVQLEGNRGNDTLFGSRQVDLLLGGAGDDVLHGGGQADPLGIGAIPGTRFQRTLAVIGTGIDRLGGVGGGPLNFTTLDDQPDTLDGGEGSDRAHAGPEDVLFSIEQITGR